MKLQPFSNTTKNVREFPCCTQFASTIKYILRSDILCCFRVSDVFVCSACGHAAFTASSSVCSRTSDNTHVTSGFRILHYVNIHQTQTERSPVAKHAAVSSNISEAGFVQENSNSNFIRKLLLHISRFGPPQSCTRWRSWLRNCATSRKVAGSIPHGVTGIFH